MSALSGVLGVPEHASSRRLIFTARRSDGRELATVATPTLRDLDRFIYQLWEGATNGGINIHNSNGGSTPLSGDDARECLVHHVELGDFIQMAIYICQGTDGANNLFLDRLQILLEQISPKPSNGEYRAWKEEIEIIHREFIHALESQFFFSPCA